MGGGTMHVEHIVTQLRNTLNNNFSSSSSSNLNPSLPTDSNTNKTLSSCCCNGKLCRKQEMTSSECLYKHVFETVPSQREVEDAISALQEFMKAISSTITIQQISDSYDSRIMLSQGYKRLYDALQMLQADPAVKRLVVSLSSDEAIWDAVIRNVLHQRLLELPHSVNCERPQISGQREIGIEIISWIFDIMKGKILELIESFQSLVNDLFQSPRIGNATQLDEKVRSSTLLSIVILLIVIVARSQSRHV
ncbi:unnamed protein product [Lathyrus oleraceus]|uniref:Uncharacterized protein n=1 Tax=Pisum sativum TaxID=3888 RepID=A0A9D4Y2B2_PEA|nr:uncharacterized protein LOC127127933 [Pisum sativum]KAI5430518.1 hypothetical protein KIW84_034920 [Pisum sativum]